MFVVRNLATNSVLCYPDGARIMEVNRELMQSRADFAQHLTGQKHEVVNIYEGPFLPLNRHVAPWLH